MLPLGRSVPLAFSTAAGLFIYNFLRAPSRLYPVGDHVAIIGCSSPSAPPVSPGRAAVLIVDDEPLVLSFLRRALNHAGFVVFAAADGESAWRHWQRHRAEIGLVITDLTMPRLDGVGLMDRLFAEPDAPAVLACSGEPEQLQGAARRFGERVQVLEKPFSVDGLFAHMPVGGH